jgi:hypothetical protein
MNSVTGLDIVPVDAERLADVVTLFGSNGANSGCWCMWFRLPAKEWSANGNAGNRAAFTAAVHSGEPVGLLAYLDGSPAGWTAVAPRPAYRRLLRSPTLRPDPPDDLDVWSVTCFFINRYRRRTGIAAALLDAAVGYAGRGGARIIEGYPVDTCGGPRASGDLYTGTVPLFTRAGFVEYRRPDSGNRIVMRRPATR